MSDHGVKSFGLSSAAHLPTRNDATFSKNTKITGDFGWFLMISIVFQFFFGLDWVSPNIGSKENLQEPSHCLVAWNNAFRFRCSLTPSHCQTNGETPVKSQSLMIQPRLEWKFPHIRKVFDPGWVWSSNEISPPWESPYFSAYNFPTRFPMRRYDLARRDAGTATVSRCMRVMKDQQLGRVDGKASPGISMGINIGIKRQRWWFHHQAWWFCNMRISPGNTGMKHQTWSNMVIFASINVDGSKNSLVDES